MFLKRRTREKPNQTVAGISWSKRQARPADMDVDMVTATRWLFYTSVFSLAFRGVEIWPGVKLSDVIIAFSAIITLSLLLRGKLLFGLHKGLVNACFAFWIILLASVMLAGFWGYEFRGQQRFFPLLELGRYPIVFALFITAVHLIEQRQHLTRVLIVLLVGAACTSAISLAAFYLRAADIILPGLLTIHPGDAVFSRTKALFHDPNHYGSFLVIPALLSLVWIWKFQRERYRIGFVGSVLLFVLFSAAAVSTGSRMTVLALVFGTALAWTLYAWIKKAWRFLIWGVAMVSLLWIMSATNLGLRLNFSQGAPGVFEALLNPLAFEGVRPDSLNTSISYRLELWKAALFAFVENPGLGVGAGNFARVYPELAERYGLDIKAWNFPHSTYLGILAETGMFGFLLMVFLLGYFLWKAYSAIVSGRDQEPALALFVILIAQYVILAFLDAFPARHLWLIFGLVYAYHHISTKAGATA